VPAEAAERSVDAAGLGAVMGELVANGTRILLVWGAPTSDARSDRFARMLARVFQAAGRVIRTENDRGAILLIDTRYSHSQYRDLFPQEWQVHHVQNHTQIHQILGEFWAEPNP